MEEESLKIEEMSRQSVPFIVSILGVAVMLSLSAVGGTVGAVKSSSSAAMVANREANILAKAYLPVLLSSACFMYSMILCMLALGRIDANITIKDAGMVVAGCLIYGFTALFTGLGIGEANKRMIIYLSQNKQLFISFLILNSTLELPAVFSLICSMVLIFQKS